MVGLTAEVSVATLGAMADYRYREIRSEPELDAIRRAGRGFLFNPPYKTLHAVGCIHTDQMTVGQRKLFFERKSDAREELDDMYGRGGWRQCDD